MEQHELEQERERAEVLDGLTVKQEHAILALMREHSVAKAAREVGVTERTIFNWLAKDDFAKAYRHFRREAFIQAIGLTQRYAPLAVNTLAQVMTDPKAPAHAKVTAATSLLRFAREGIELDDLAARVDVLEKSLEREAEEAAA